MLSIKQLKVLDLAIALAGGVGALAEKLGIVQGAVSNWKVRGNIPAEYCPAIERESGGAVTCEELRPDVDWAVIRSKTRRRLAAGGKAVAAT